MRQDADAADIHNNRPLAITKTKMRTTTKTKSAATQAPNLTNMRDAPNQLLPTNDQPLERAPKCYTTTLAHYQCVTSNANANANAASDQRNSISWFIGSGSYCDGTSLILAIVQPSHSTSGHKIHVGRSCDSPDLHAARSLDSLEGSWRFKLRAASYIHSSRAACNCRYGNCACNAPPAAIQEASGRKCAQA